MPTRVFASLLITFAVLTTADTSTAQEFRVYTRVSEPGRDASPIVARSLTLFRSGKSYDYMEDIGEVVITDPVKRQFTILNGGTRGTRVAFEELSQYLNVARNETEAYADDLASQPGQQEAAKSLKFQLIPDFELKHEDDRLLMTSPHWTYDVATAEPSAPEYASRYADYADMVARLNFVLHPHSFYPAVRESLNAELRKSQRIPTRVHVTARIGGEIQRAADHQYRWELMDDDRRLISKWERLAASEDVIWVSFREYQQRLLAGG